MAKHRSLSNVSAAETEVFFCHFLTSATASGVTVSDPQDPSPWPFRKEFSCWEGSWFLAQHVTSIVIVRQAFLAKEPMRVGSLSAVANEPLCLKRVLLLHRDCCCRLFAKAFPECPRSLSTNGRIAFFAGCSMGVTNVS
jgi:hypothetical protein